MDRELRAGRRGASARGGAVRQPPGDRRGRGGAWRGDPFVGREAELERVVEAVRCTHSVQTRTVPSLFVQGEPGIGKTRLLAEAANLLIGEGWRVAMGNAWDEFEAPPFWPWTQVARLLTGDSSSKHLAELVLDTPGVPGRFELFEATAELLRRSSLDQPVLILLDDLHAADVPSLLLTRFVTQQVGHHPIALVGAYRSNPDDPEIATQLTALTQAGSVLALGGLPAPAVARLFGAGAEASDVHAVTGGNPLFVEQVARLAAGGEMRPDIPRGQLTSDALRSAISFRIRLLGEARHTLTALAVLGGETTPSTLAGLLGAEAAGLDADIEALDVARLIRRADDDTIEITHSLVAETALTVAEPGFVAGLHLRAADLMSDDPQRVVELAHHLLRAGQQHARRAAEACVRAGQAADAATAHEAAVGHFERALAALGDDDDRYRLDILLELGRAQRRSDLVPEAEQTFTLVEQIADELGDPEARALAALRGGVQYFFMRDRDAVVVDRCRAALDGLPDGDSPLRARLLADLAASTSVTDPAERRTLAQRSVDMARRLDDPLALGYALLAQIVTTFGPSTLTDRLAASREVLALARTTGEPALAVHARYGLLGALLERGDIRGLEAELVAPDDPAGPLADRTRARFSLWLACTRALLDGDTARAEDAAERCLALATGHDAAEGLRVYGGQIGVIRALQGRSHELEDAYEQAIRARPENRTYSAALAMIRAGGGRPDAARAALADVGDLARIPDDMHWLVTMVLVAEAAAEVGETDLVIDVWERLLPYADRFVPVNQGAAVFGTVARRLGLLALRLDRVDEAIGHFEQAIAVCARLGARPWLVEGQLDLAEALERAGRDNGTRFAEVLSEAAATARLLDIDRLTERARRLGDTLHEPVRTPVPAPDLSRPAISVLGAFEVMSADGQVARWSSRKARELLKVLVTRRGAPVHREVLMDLLWPDVEPAALGNRLSVALSTVRRALDPDRTLPTDAFVTAGRDAVRLRIDMVDVDAEHFLDVADRALAASDSGDADSLTSLVEAARAHHGPAMPDEPYAEWALAFQREVEITYLRVLRELAGRAAAAGEHLTAIDAYRRLVEIDSGDTSARHGLVDALDHVGAHTLAAEERARAV